jgi:tRNA pseudouridine55 synthase
MVRKTLGIRKVGHLGTLDPIASGLMGILIGRATLLATYLVVEDKEYEGEILLGVKTDTDDITGKILEDLRDKVPLSLRSIEEAREKLMGTRPQVPPSFSAISSDGVRAHKRARQGEVFTLPPRMVTLKRFDILGYDPPLLKFKALVSKGFYIRALARDLGVLLGLPGGALRSLRRLSIGSFSIKDAISPPFTPEELYSRLISPREALGFLPEFVLNPRDLGLVKTGGYVFLGGQKRRTDSFIYPRGYAQKLVNGLPSGFIKLIDREGELIAIGEATLDEPHKKPQYMAGDGDKGTVPQAGTPRVPPVPGERGGDGTVDFKLSSRYKSEAPETSLSPGGPEPVPEGLSKERPLIGEDLEEGPELRLPPPLEPDPVLSPGGPSPGNTPDSLDPAPSSEKPRRDLEKTPERPFLRPLRVF